MARGCVSSSPVVMTLALFGLLALGRAARKRYRTGMDRAYMRMSTSVLRRNSPR